MESEPFCPFCNIRMYSVIDDEYPRLTVYQCYSCGFHVDTILMSQRSLFQNYQWLFAHSRGALVPKKLMPKRASDEMKHDKFSDANGTEPVSGNYKSYSKITVILNMPSKNYINATRNFRDFSQTFHLEVS